MRITNSMVTNNVLLHLNKSQEAMMKYEYQMATGKKINRPSDDPIVATRSLKLRTNVSEINQYQRNVDDAVSWMDVTEQGFDNIIEMFQRTRELCVKGSSDSYTSDEKSKILNEIMELKDQIGQEGNITYAGRYVFSGFKTDTALIFSEDQDIAREIEQSFTYEDIARKRVVVDDTSPQDLEVSRLRLGYSNIDGLVDFKISPVGPNGAGIYDGYVIKEMDSSDALAYEPADGAIHLLRDTGELIFNDNNISNDMKITINYDKTKFYKGEQDPVHYYKTYSYETVDELEMVTGTNIQAKISNIPIVEGSISNINFSPAVPAENVIYTDSNTTATLNAEDFRVDMDTGIITFGSNYSAVTVTDLQYQYEVDGRIDQNIEYEISVNQKITVNSLGKTILTGDALRDLEELVNECNTVFDTIATLNDEIENVEDDTTLTETEKSNAINALNERLALQEDIIGDFFSEMLGKFDKNMEQISKNQAALGTKINRLELTQSRLLDDEINFTEILSNSEDVDLAEVMVKMRSQEMVYNAALLSSSKIIQPILLDFLR